MNGTADSLRDEEQRMRRLRFMADLSLAVLMQANLTPAEAFRVLEDARQAALALFPGTGPVFDLVYRPRFLRVIRERFVIPGGQLPK